LTSIGSACPDPNSGICRFISSTTYNDAAVTGKKCILSCPTNPSYCQFGEGGPYFTQASCPNFALACSTNLDNTYDDGLTQARSCGTTGTSATPVPAPLQ